MANISFTVGVIAINPKYDSQGNEYICVEFGNRPLKVPAMFPTNISEEMSEMIEASKGVVKILAPHVQSYMRRYANRLTIYLTSDEWERLSHKYTIGDTFQVTVNMEGNITLTST